MKFDGGNATPLTGLAEGHLRSKGSGDLRKGSSQGEVTALGRSARIQGWTGGCGHCLSRGGASITPAQDANATMVDTSKQSSWESLRGATLICLPADSPVQRLVNRQLGAFNCIPTEKTQVNQIETAVMMAEAGFGVAVVPSFAASICKKYSVEARTLQPPVECSFYFIVRAGQEVVEQLGFFSHEFAGVLGELAAGPGVSDTPPFG